MTYNEIVNELKSMASAKGLEARDESNAYNLRIEYYSNGEWIGGASYIGCAEHPEYMSRYDMEGAREQIKYLAKKAAS